jgi:hypothetical protein
MHFEGSFETLAPRQTVYDFLLNPKDIAPCFPDLQSMGILSLVRYVVFELGKVKLLACFIHAFQNFQLLIAQVAQSTGQQN